MKFPFQGGCHYPLRGFFNTPRKGGKGRVPLGFAPQFPAIAGTGEEENTGIMTEPIASLEDKEFL